MASCLTDTRIDEYIAETLPEGEATGVEAHLETCRRCRRKVEARRRSNDRLFHAIQDAHSDETLALDDRGASTPPPWKEGIEGYEILSEIHRGGQGVVCKAVQRATHRVVALKVLREGQFASAKQRQRFEREVDLVAGLQHKNIVTIYDSGVTADGRHYFAMEYIHGRSLDVHLTETSPSLEQTLRLFQDICAAVSYAHQHGVIHRDLKPGNIRVDANGDPHILDFGLAKAAGQELARDGSPLTVTGEFMGTLAYASPEQVKGDPTLIDTRTDVYSLGVILYQMLTGRYPYEVVGQMAQVLKNIAEAEPQRPSTIRRQINDEVETIVLTALTKEKERRYQSAAALAEDVGRYLAGEPIEAKRESRLYVLKKTLAHYQRHVLVAGVVLGLVFVAVGVFLHSRWSLALQQEAARLVLEAGQLMELPSRRHDAQRRLERALELDADFAPAHLRLGQLYAIQGLAAPLEEKDRHLRQAVQECYRAHRAAGGRPIGEPPLERPEGDRQPGMRSALMLAANLLLLGGEREQAEPYFALAGRLAPDATRASPGDDTGWWIPIYDQHKDPLVRSPRLITASPDSAGMTPDWSATVRRAIRTEFRDVDPVNPPRSHEVTELLFDRLFRVELGVGGALAVTPNEALVETVIGSEAAPTLDVVLRPGLTWHDGRPVTAEDVVFSWELLRDSERTVSSVEPIAGGSVRITCEEGAAAAEWELDFAVLPKHIYSDGRATPDAGEEREPVGSGPYRWSAESSAERVVLERWEAYPGRRPYFARVEFHVVPDRENRIRALADRRLDVVELSGVEFRWAVNGASFQRHVWKFIEPRGSYDFICWNADGSNPFFDNRDVRRAMTHAMNLNRIIQHRVDDLYDRSTGIYSTGAWMFNPDMPALEYDPDEARRLLGAAGWTLGENAAGIRARGGRKFEFTLLVPEESRDFLSWVYDLQQDLRDVGVAMNVQTLPFRECIRRARAHDFDAFTGRFATSPHPGQESLRWKIGGEDNYGGYSNAAVDSLYERARRLPRNRQREHYRQIQELIYADQPYTFLWHTPTLLAVNHRLRGLRFSPLGVTRFHPGPRAWWIPADNK